MNVNDLKIGNTYEFYGRTCKVFRVVLMAIKTNPVSKRKYYSFSKATTMNMEGEYLLSPTDVSLWLYPDDMTSADVLKKCKEIGVSVIG